MPGGHAPRGAGTHYDEEQHLCVDPRRDGKGTHCFAYFEDLTAEEGKATDIRVCMDQYEAPNLRGERPFVMRSFESARRWCGDRGKRVCSEQEWGSPARSPGPSPRSRYGWAVDVKKCNSDKPVAPLRREEHPARRTAGRAGRRRAAPPVAKEKGAPSGAYATCVSPFGILDMMGNVEEWVASRARARRARDR